MGLNRNRRWVAESARYIVGARVGLFWASHPFGRLSANRDQIVISAVFRKAALERPHVITVYTTRALVRRVIGFRTDDGSGDGVFVYSVAPNRILAALEEFGWDVAQ